jgi:pullulanase/glycogen debranching enzyme
MAAAGLNLARTRFAMLFARPERLLPGSPYPLGATPDGLGVNFAVFSANATRIELCLFDVGGRKEIARLPLPECTNEVWHGYLPDAGPGLHYGYRAHGPYEPERGQRFNPTSCCWTLMPARCRGRCAGATRCSATGSTPRAPT